MSAVLERKQEELWGGELSNPVAPVGVVISPDGQRVVTMDDWYEAGYGSNVVANYGPGGQLARYSLEEFAPIKGPKDDELLRWEEYRGKFRHTTSSRHWQERCIYFFSKLSGDSAFCLWLDWDERWVLWEMEHGKLIQATEELNGRLDAEGRAHSLEAIKRAELESATRRSNPFPALYYLARTRYPEDRPLVEKLLSARDFSGGLMSVSGPGESYFAYTSASMTREEGDKILSKWDGRGVNSVSSEKYNFLGTLKCKVVLPANAEGKLRAVLIPDAQSLKEWDSISPEHYLIASLDHKPPPFVFQSRKLAESDSPKEINLIIYGVTPGKYRVKAIWTENRSCRMMILLRNQEWGIMNRPAAQWWRF